MRYLALATIAFSIALAVCDNQIERVAKYREASDVRPVSAGYFHYTIEGGAVTCREHRSRSELACWNTVPKTPQ